MFFKPNKTTSYGIGVNVDKGESQFELVKELGVKNLLIRMPLWEVHNITKYLSFVKKFKEQDRSISIVLNILQDRDNIENHDILSKNIRIIFQAFSPYVSEFQV
ncbi:MAG: hypothetical protein VX335_05410 [Pseudomonadota bacterium]|nr:hypothetical protein [Pseudomonadota bacterium]